MITRRDLFVALIAVIATAGYMPSQIEAGHGLGEL